MATDTEFEAKLSQLANSQLADRVPSLMPNQVGFQLVDKDDDETRAMGVAAFVLNKLFLYIPVFFIEGKLKGLDLLYVYQADMFVPTSDQMISMLEQEGVETLGKVKPMAQAADEGGFKRPSEVQLQNYPESFTFKGASNLYMDEAAFQKMAAARSRSALPSLENDLEKLGKQANKAFVNTLLGNTQFANAMLQYYSPGELQKIAQSAAAEVYMREGEVTNEPDVKFVVDPQSEEARGLEPAAKKLFMRNGVYILDNRDNFSKVFQTDIDTSLLQNPTEPGIYDVLMSGGKLRTFIILIPEVLDKAPDVMRRSDRNIGKKVALIDISNPEEYFSAETLDIFCKPSTKLTKKQLNGLKGGEQTSKQALAQVISDARSKEQSSFPNRVVPLTVYKRVLIVQSPESAMESELYQNSEAMSEARIRGRSDGYAGNFCSRADKYFTPEFVSEDGHLSIMGDVLLIPEGCRFFRKTDEQLDLGSPTLISNMIQKTAEDMHRLTLQFTGTTGELRYNGRAKSGLDKIATLKELTLRHGIHAGTAQKLLKQASRAPYQTREFMIKYAAPYDMAAYGDAEPPWMGGPSPEQEAAVTLETSTQTGPALTGPEDAEGTPLLPGKVIERASAAAGQGIKEVFDTSVLSGLIDVADMAEVRRDYITQMIKGMDSVGRMLFLFYWHKENFEQRYGKLDMKQLEDTLRNVFTSTGDLVIFLREKTVYNGGFAESMFGALSEDIGTAAE